jgi:hypothetical protein
MDITGEFVGARSGLGGLVRVIPRKVVLWEWTVSSRRRAGAEKLVLDVLNPRGTVAQAASRPAPRLASLRVHVMEYP